MKRWAALLICSLAIATSEPNATNFVGVAPKGSGDIRGKPEMTQRPPRPVGPVQCTQFHFPENSDTKDKVLKVFQLDDATLATLNNGKARVVPGQPICIAGQLASGKRVGKAKTVVSYQLVAGVDTCTSVLLRTSPPVSLAHFVAINPLVLCDELAEKGGKINLPAGTKVLNAAVIQGKAAATPGVCEAGPWGNWTTCEAGQRSRYRNIYQFNRAPCSGISDVEQEECASSQEIRTAEGKFQTTADQPLNCPMPWYDGCSVPSWAPYYYLFVPACNVHDLCWGCLDHPNLQGKSRTWCDNDFRNKMGNLCSWRWPSWSQLFDRTYCVAMADAYRLAVIFGNPGNPRGWQLSANTAYLSSGCEYTPWDSRLNNAADMRSKGFDPNRALRNGVKCNCYGTSCQFRT